MNKTEAIDYLLRAKDSLDMSLEYESAKQEFAICSLLWHLKDCIDHAVRLLEPNSETETPKPSRRLIERGL